MRSVAVIGIGETKFGRFPDRSIRELIAEAGKAAMHDAGLGAGDVQALFFSNFNAQLLSGQGQMAALASEVLGLGHIPAFRTEGACASGSLAFKMGLMSVMCGMQDIVLVGGVEKMTHRPTEIVTDALASAMDYNLEASQGFTFPGNFAMIANRYFHEYRNVKKEMALCAINAHRNAILNPDAQMQKEITMEKVLSSQMIADPISLFDSSLISDGSAFLVLATTELARKLNRHRVVEVIGSGHAGDTITLFSKRCITSFAAAKAAANQAYLAANIKPSDVDFAEVHDCFTITQIINIEDLGFAEAGHGADLVASGEIALEGRIPINPSGGLKAKGHPIGATGLSQIFEVVTQLRRQAGQRQLRKADIGLTHNLGGTAATCVVNIFKGE